MDEDHHGELFTLAISWRMWAMNVQVEAVLLALDSRVGHHKVHLGAHIDGILGSEGSSP